MQPVRAQPKLAQTCRWKRHVAAQALPDEPPQAADDSTGDDEEWQGEEWQGLEKEDDWVVPGTNMGSLSQNTELGRAVDSACDELQVLSSLENSVLQDAQAILEKMGYTKSLFEKGATAPESADQPDEKADA